MGSHHRPAPLDEDTTVALNLQVLKRLDPATTEILASAGQVALYDFSDDTKTWIRRDVEGALFLLRRSTLPTFQFTILNRKCQSNYHEEIHAGFDFEEQNDKYMLYTDALSQVRCLWFHSAKERTLLARHIRSIAVASHVGWRNLGANVQPIKELYSDSGGPALLSRLQNRHPTVSNTQSSSQQHMASGTGDSSTDVILDLFNNIRLAQGVQPQTEQLTSLDQRGRDGASCSEAWDGELETIAPSGAALPTAQKPVPQCGFSNGSVDTGHPHPPQRNVVVRSGGGNGCAAGGSGAASLRPPLLAPSFFGRHHSVVGSRSGDFSGTSTAIPSHASVAQPRSFPCTAAPDGQRAAVRRAILELANQPEFADMILRALLHTQVL